MTPWRDALAAPRLHMGALLSDHLHFRSQLRHQLHMDYSHVIAWQIYGGKRFRGLVEPGTWTTRQQRVTYNSETFERPADLTDDDALCYDMPPGPSSGTPSSPPTGSPPPTMASP